MMCEAYISVGSNHSSGDERVREALHFLEKNFSEVECSSVYVTPSVSKNDNSLYHNAVAYCKIDRTLSQEDLNELLKTYEISVGRVKGSKEVLIDLDLVVYNNEIVRPVDFSRSYFSIGYDELNL